MTKNRPWPQSLWPHVAVVLSSWYSISCLPYSPYSFFSELNYRKEFARWFHILKYEASKSSLPATRSTNSGIEIKKISEITDQHRSITLYQGSKWRPKNQHRRTTSNACGEIVTLTVCLPIAGIWFVGGSPCTPRFRMALYHRYV